MMKKPILHCLTLLLLTSCYTSTQAPEAALVSIQIQDRNGITETISQPDRLETFTHLDFLASHPYKKVLRVFKQDGKLSGVLTTYHPNGLPHQYLEAQDMRAFGPYREWHPNGKLKIEATVIGGTADLAVGTQKNWLFDGQAQIWDERGALLAQISYNKGVMEGITRHYYPSGQVKQELSYFQNDLEGESIEYFPNGTIESRMSYKRGMKHGKGTGFWTEGQPKWVENFQDGLLLEASYYSSVGHLISEVKGGFGYQAILKDGNIEQMVEIRRGKTEGLVKVFFPNTEIKAIYHIKNGMKQGEEIEYYPSSERAEEGSTPIAKISLPWEGNVLSGVVKTWYNNGNLQSQKELSRNKKSGSALGWYRDGNLMYMEEYEDDRLSQGKYYKKNSREAFSTISNGNGFATLYDENGVFLRKIQYLKGKPIDPDN